jgi:probable F420-dependent oxidoreductase
MRDLQFGVALQRSDGVAEAATAFEDLGFDYVASGEHVSFYGPTPNAFVSLAVAAGATRRIRLLSTIALAPLYPAALLAKLGAALDVASGGRFELGVGVGGENPREFDACGVPVGERGARTDEALEVLRRLWTEPTVDFDGRFSRFEGVSIAPRPASTPHPPIWVAGRKEPAMRRTARHGDGWMPYMYTPEMLASSVDRIGELRAEAGRADDPVRVGLFIWSCVHEVGATARQLAAASLSKIYNQDFSSLVDRYALAGSPEEVTTRLREYHDAGAGLVVVSGACPAGHEPEHQRLLAGEVRPAFVSAPAATRRPG